MANTNANGNPASLFNLKTANKKSFDQMTVDFSTWAQGINPGAFQKADGWALQTPDDSLDFLIRQARGGNKNRRVAFNTVVYYGAQMIAGDWIETGETVSYDKNGVGLNGQHRSWASVLTGKSFPTYVVATVPPRDMVFAYIDNVKPRRPEDALYTAGHDGAARLIARTVELARHYDAGVMTPSSKGQVVKASPMDVLRYAMEHAEIRNAVSLLESAYDGAADLFLYRDVAAFVTWKILAGYDEDTVDEFMLGLIEADPTDANGSADPIVALRKKLDAFAKQNESVPAPGKKKNRIKSATVLAHAVKAFNAWTNNESMKTLAVRVDEPFPRFATSAASQQAA